MSSSLLRIAACIALSVAVAALAPDDPTLRTALAIFALAGSLWMTQALPLTVTALLVPLLAVLMADMSPSRALASFAHPILFLFLGGFALADFGGGLLLCRCNRARLLRLALHRQANATR